jgi:hypothetical protein
MKLTRGTIHWLPTRSHKVEGIRAILASMKKMKNVSVRYSSDKINGLTLKHGSFVFDQHMFPDLEVGEGIEICRANTRGGECGDCRSCWDKTVKIIAYPAHGKNMKRVVAGLSN